MRRFCVLALAVALAATGCGAAEDAEIGTQSDVAFDGAFDDANAQPSDESQDAARAWFLSEARPVNRACNEPGYRPGQPDTNPTLDMPLYPALQDKIEQLQQDLQALRPQITDDEAYDLAADQRIRQEIAILSQLVFVAGQDLPPNYLLGVCNIEAYEQDGCAVMQRMLASTLTLQDLERQGEALSYTAILAADGSRSDLYIANRDLDGLRLERFSNAAGQYSGEWQRAQDGTETFSATSPDTTYRYTERPDCSGRAQALRVDAGGHPWTLSWQWTSALEPAEFSIQYSECKTNGLDEQECLSGQL